MLEYARVVRASLSYSLTTSLLNFKPLLQFCAVLARSPVIHSLPQVYQINESRIKGKMVDVIASFAEIASKVEDPEMVCSVFPAGRSLM